MIKLPNYSENYKANYWKSYQDKILESVRQNFVFWKSTFPESVNEEVANEMFFKELLTMPVPDFNKKYDSVNSYFKLASFCSLDIEIFMIDGHSEKDIRKCFVEKYLGGNKLIEDLSIDFSTTCESKGSFKELKEILIKHLSSKNEIIHKAIDYGRVNRKTRAEIIADLNIRVCPYCNRNYVNNFSLSKYEQPSGDMDHLYPKDCFSLYELSLYNFVPSCKVCNSVFKGNKNYDIAYPYSMNKNTNLKYSIKDDETNNILSPGSLFGWNQNIQIEISPVDEEDEEAVKREKKLFNLNEQYDIHTEEAKRFLYKKNIIEQLMSKDIIDYLKKKPEFRDASLDEIIWGYDFENTDFLKQPLSNLMFDLYKNY